MAVEDGVPEGQNEGVAPEPRRCRALNQDGTPCRASPQWLGDSGLCLAHDPDREAERQHARTLGGLRTGARRRKGLNPSDLPPLRTPQDAKAWAARIATAVATGELSGQQGRVSLAAVKLWLEAHDAEEVAERLARVEAQVKGRRRVPQ